MAWDATLADGYVVSDDPARLDVDAIHRFISEESYWGRGRARAITERSLANSLCLGLYAPDGAFAGFARLTTDLATNGHLSDVFVLPPHRGKGLGKALVAAMLGHPELRTVFRWTLSTRDAQALYAGFGFGAHPRPHTQMIRLLGPEIPGEPSATNP